MNCRIRAFTDLWRSLIRTRILGGSTGFGRKIDNTKKQIGYSISNKKNKVNTLFTYLIICFDILLVTYDYAYRQVNAMNHLTFSFQDY